MLPVNIIYPHQKLFLKIPMGNFLICDIGKAVVHSQPLALGTTDNDNVCNLLAG